MNSAFEKHRVYELLRTVPKGRVVTYGRLAVRMGKRAQASSLENLYVQDPHDVRCVSFSANGDVLGGNMYKRDIMEMIRDYAP